MCVRGLKGCIRGWMESGPIMLGVIRKKRSIRGDYNEEKECMELRGIIRSVWNYKACIKG